MTTIPKRSFCSFCPNMFFSREGHRRYVASNSFGAKRAYEIGGPYIYHCHCNLVDISAPIIVNGSHFGSVSCGQILLETLTKIYRERVHRRLAPFSEEFRAHQMKALDEVPVVPLTRVRGLAKLLSVVANNTVNLIISNMRERETSVQTAKLLAEIKARSLLEKEIENPQLPGRGAGEHVAQDQELARVLPSPKLV